MEIPNSRAVRVRRVALAVVIVAMAAMFVSMAAADVLGHEHGDPAHGVSAAAFLILFIGRDRRRGRRQHGASR